VVTGCVGIGDSEGSTTVIEFAFLTACEVEGALVRWDDDAPKPASLIAAAVAAGFSRDEADESPLGVLEETYWVTPEYAFDRGARVLIGMNGSTLIEVRPETSPDV
jgi:hypothetical protein